MADNLIFPVQFDLEGAVRKAQGDAEKYLRRLETTIRARPVEIDVKVGDPGSLDAIRSRMNELSREWNALAESERVAGAGSGEYTVRARAMIEEFGRLTVASESYARSLQAIAADSRRAAAETERMQKARLERDWNAAADEHRREQAREENRILAETARIKREAARQEAAQQQAVARSVAKRQRVVDILRAEENSVVAITAKLQHWQRVMNSSAMDGRQFGRATQEVQRLSQKLSEAQARIERLTATTAEAGERQGAAVRRVRGEYEGLDGYVSRLVKRLAVYASFSYAGQFLSGIREVTAEFELQRVSLGAIIQDQQKANALFAEIKSFALTSPVKILDLTKYTKQVAAYGIETEKLLGTTKMLADISVGLGVDMSRLTLFFGQVYATGYLRASEVRQATEAGIPLVDKLAKKLSEANGKLVSAAEVMDLISKRAISFEQVEEVFRDMTSAGGEFYNMQVKQSQTLFGMWSKLGDAAAIMYDQIGNTSSVNAGMKTAIGMLDSLMRNWKTTARVLDTVGVALGVYVLGLKNAAVASKALTGAVALENLAHQQQVIRTPKVVAGIIGINNAKKISTLLTGLHTKAVLSEAAATNVLTKGFWKLTAAMLANPWVAAAAAIAGVVAAIVHFTGNAETAADRAEKLNDSVASLKNLEDTAKPLVDTYNDLIGKTDRTAEEQKKLSEVTHELAKRYPGAINAVGDFGEEVELAADKLNELYAAEKKARMDNTREELEATEQKIEETKAEIAKYQSYINSIVSGKLVVPTLFGERERDADEGDLKRMRDFYLKQIKLLRFGEDGNGGLEALTESAETARRALGIIPSEAAQAVEKFGSWKKTLSTFEQQVGGVRVRLFDDSTIAQFGSLEEALAKAAEGYRSYTETVADCEERLKSSRLNKEERGDILAAEAEAEAGAALAKNALEYYNALGLIAEREREGEGGRNPRSTRRQALLDEIGLVEKLYKEYVDMARLEGVSRAEADMRRLYADSLQELADKYGIELPRSVESFKAGVDVLIGKLRELRAQARNDGERRNIDIALREATYKRDKAGMDAAQRAVEDELKELAERISRTRTARDFYDKILGATGDYGLAGRVAESIFGQNGERLQKAVADQVRGMTKGIELPEGIISADNIVDYRALRQFAEANKEELGNMYEALVRISEQGQKDLAKTYEGYLKDLEKAKSYSDKRIELARYTAKQIAEIEASGLPEGEKKRLTSGYREREEREAAKLEYEAFKDMPMYVQMFADLDHASTSTLENMKRRLTEMQGAWKNLDPTQLKEMQSRLAEIDEQLAKRNPFKILTSSMKEYRELREKHGSEGALGREINVATDAYLQAKAALAAQLETDPNDKDAVENLQRRVDLSEEELKQLQKIADAYAKVKKSIGLSLGEVFGIAGALGDLAGGIGKVTEALGGDREDVEYWNDIATALNDVTGGIENMVQGALSGNPIRVVTSAVTAIPNIISGFAGLFSAGKVRRANKEIRRQKELLEALDYTYGRLEVSADKVFGREYLNNYSQQLKNLQAQQTAYLKQAAAERSKGKKADEDAIREYENQARETADRIKELEDDLGAHFTGSSRTDAARQMAKSWVDARASMSDTFAAIKGDYQEMVKNMIVEGAAARVIENALTPVWDSMEKMLAKNDMQGAIDSLIGGMDSALNAANNGMEVLWKALEARGYDMKQLIGETDSEYTGIAKSVAGATSEEILQLSGFVNTALYYMAPIPRIDENLARVVALMEGRGAALPAASGSTAGGADYTDLFNTANEHLSSLPRMEQHLSEIHRMLGRIVVTRGGAFGVNAFMNG